MVSVVLDPNSLKYTAICTTLLGFKIVAVMFGMGSSRVAAGCRPPEDIVLFPKNGPQSFDGSCRADKSDNPKHQQRAETEIRWARIMANDLENIPIGLFMIFLSLLCGSSKSVHLYLTTIFTVARYANQITTIKILY